MMFKLSGDLTERPDASWKPRDINLTWLNPAILTSGRDRPINMTSCLPPEILCLVFRDVCKADLKAARLACRQFDEIASGLLFERVYASVHLRDLEVLTAIASHPRLRQSVREIVYAGVYFYEGRVRDSAHPYSKTGLRYFRDRLEEQQETMRSGRDVRIIAAALAQMPHVQTLTLTDHWLPTRNPLDRDPLDVRLSARHGSVRAPGCGGPFARGYPPFTPEPLGLDVLARQGKGDRGFRVMCRAVSLAGAHIQTLVVDYYHVGLAGDSFAFFLSSSSSSSLSLSSDLANACTAVRHVRRAALCIAPVVRTDDNDNDDDDRQGRQWQLADVLAAATGLETLSAQLSARNLQTCLGRQGCWPRLRTLHLHQFCAEPHELVTFLQRHRATLRSLFLGYALLLSGSWKAVTREIRARLALDSVAFYVLTEADPPFAYSPFWQGEKG